MNVHEGPCGISRGIKTVFKEGMCVSDEPGYYEDGEFGIRIENMMYIKNSSFDGFLSFETLTLIPYAKDLILIEMLTQEEINFIKNYYSKIQKKLKPLLSDKANKWLEEELNFIP